jgi:hypothetical protein
VPAGTLSDFKVSFGTALSGYWHIRSRSARTEPAQRWRARSTAIGNNNGTSQTSAIACINPTNSVTLAAGDLISVQVVPSNSPSAKLIGWTATFTPS